MSTKTVEAPFPRRTSERRRLKMLRNLDEYKISNPYKSLKSLPDIPDHIVHQLSKVDYLSSTSISLLSFTQKSPLELNHHTNLSKMRDAFLSQEQRMAALLGQSSSVESENPEMIDEDSMGDTLRAGHCSGEEVITTREQLSMSFITFHDNPFPRVGLQGGELGLLQSEPEDSMVRNLHCRDDEMVIMDQDYEQYFTN